MYLKTTGAFLYNAWQPSPPYFNMKNNLTRISIRNDKIPPPPPLFSIFIEIKGREVCVVDKQYAGNCQTISTWNILAASGNLACLSASIALLKSRRAVGSYKLK